MDESYYMSESSYELGYSREDNSMIKSRYTSGIESPSQLPVGKCIDSYQMIGGRKISVDKSGYIVEVFKNYKNNNEFLLKDGNAKNVTFYTVNATRHTINLIKYKKYFEDFVVKIYNNKSYFEKEVQAMKYLLENNTINYDLVEINIDNITDKFLSISVNNEVFGIFIKKCSKNNIISKFKVIVVPFKLIENKDEPAKDEPKKEVSDGTKKKR
jgi:hypothetical protein